ncbi:MAG: amidohydrolase [Desulfobacteraceae bacterium]|nr:amidohydrolase [Desulfobacteraceae bacterium]
MDGYPMDLVVKNGIVLTMNKGMEILHQGWVGVDKECIAAMGSQDTLPQPGAETEIDARGGIIMPGLVNCHTHAPMTLFRGLACGLPPMAWLNRHVSPTDERLARESVYMGSLLACAEMILSGTTCFCDSYRFGEEVARAASTTGLRAVVGELFTGLAAGGDRGDTLPARLGNHALVTVAVGLPSVAEASSGQLQGAAALAGKHGVPLVMPVAETEKEVSQIEKMHGRSPAGFLESLGLLGPGLVACHSIHLTENDMALYKHYDVKVVHCPESDMACASGVAPIPRLLGRGVIVGLGTDAGASNGDLDLFCEMDTAAKLHKVFAMDPEVINAETAVKMATINGARVLGLDGITGSLETGKRADIIVVDLSGRHLVPMYNPYSHLVYSAAGSDVAASVIDGKLVMADREIKSMDLGTVMNGVREICRKKGAL